MNTSYLDEMSRLMEALKDRRVYGGRDDLSLWTSVDITPNAIESTLSNIDRVTTGQFVLLFHIVAFKDERDAVAFKLAN